MIEAFESWVEAADGSEHFMRVECWRKPDVLPGSRWEPREPGALEIDVIYLDGEEVSLSHPFWRPAAERVIRR